VNVLTRKGTTERRPVRSEIDGRPAGYHLEHWDDHVDARVQRAEMHLHVPDGRGGAGLLVPGLGLIVQPPEDPGPSEWPGGQPVIGGGAWGNSGIYLVTFIDVFDATQLAIDLSLATHKWAMYNNTETPNYSTESAYAATNEVTGTGYTAGGQVIVSPTNTESPAGTYMYDMADQVWASPTTVTAYGAKLYADVLAGNNLICALTFGGAFTSTAGTFTIQFASTGVFYFDLTP
jgi:hypothetical protein